MILDAASIDDINCSAGISLAGLCDYLDAKAVTLVLARADTSVLHVLNVYGLKHRFP